MPPGKILSFYRRAVRPLDLARDVLRPEQGGVEEPSLFKSFTAECFEEHARDDPEAAARLTISPSFAATCRPGLKDDPVWRLHRAVLATLPGVRIVDQTPSW